ncbi:hypothetical protein [Rhizobium beringeri]|jgi:hypothetical protein
MIEFNCGSDYASWAAFARTAGIGTSDPSFRNGFDFSKDFGPNLYFSQSQNERFLAKPKAKFFIAMPFVLVVTSFISIFIILTLTGVIKPCIGCGR